MVRFVLVENPGWPVSAPVRRGTFSLCEKVVVGDGFEPSKALADRFTVCTL